MRSTIIRFSALSFGLAQHIDYDVQIRFEHPVITAETGQLSLNP
ncbi:MAG: hypothetical protein PHH91_01200 [Desulfuromonadaceae bacterium]|nr:hypothetical protein [Desulfuromonadaceae bacterium]